jgi:hypothetical protein
MDDAFSVVTLAVASAALGAVGFAEGAVLMGWPFWASAAAGVVALAAGIAAFKPVVVHRQPPRSPRRRAKKAAPSPFPEILPPVKPAATAKRPKKDGGRG